MEAARAFPCMVHTVRAENLRFAMPETGIGFYPDVAPVIFCPGALIKQAYI